MSSKRRFQRQAAKLTRVRKVKYEDIETMSMDSGNAPHLEPATSPYQFVVDFPTGDARFDLLLSALCRINGVAVELLMSEAPPELTREVLTCYNELVADAMRSVAQGWSMARCTTQFAVSVDAARRTLDGFAVAVKWDGDGKILERRAPLMFAKAPVD